MDRFFINNTSQEYVFYIDQKFYKTGYLSGDFILNGDKGKLRLLEWKKSFFEKVEKRKDNTV